MDTNSNPRPRYSSRSTRSSVPELPPSVLKDFAPRSPKKKPIFSPDISPDSSPSSGLLRFSGHSPTQSSESTPDISVLLLTQEEADAQDLADCTRHEALLSTRRAEIAEINQRSESRHARKSPGMTQELAKQKKRWQELKEQQHPSVTIPNTSRQNRTPQPDAPRKTGAALLEQRLAEKTEMLARMSSRRSSKVTVILDYAKRNETDDIIARQAAERLEMVRQRGERERIAFQASMVRSKSASMFESCGTEEILTSLPEIAAAEKEKKHYDTVRWMFNEMETIAENVQENQHMPEVEIEDFSIRINNVLALDAARIYGFLGSGEARYHPGTRST